MRIAVAICAGLATVLGASFASSSHPRVETAYGAVEGRNENGARVFKGIPYAAAPVGALRWKAPARKAPWSEPKDAGAFGPACIQPERRGRARRIGPQSEDCLTLNIWSPEKAKKAPVMVWIHGGAFRIGSAAVPYYDGAAFARSGVVLVSINYRLGGFGFFAHEALREENGDVANFGLLDQVAALAWVKENIAAFGGDPDNVTIFGESAGGASVLYLLTVDHARGLFQKAIVESGGGQQSARCAWRACGGRPPQSERAAEWAAAQGFDHPGPDDLRSIPAEDVLTYAPLSAGPGFGPLIDDFVVSANIYERFTQGAAAAVPLIIGSNSFEASLMRAFGLTSEAVFATYGPLISEARQAYRVDERGLSDDAFASALFRDALFGAPAKLIAREMRQTGAPAWRYYFDYVLTRRRGTAPGARHAAEIPFVFDTLDATPATRFRISEEDRRMAARMHALWTNFAKTGKAGAPGEAWPAASEDGAPVLVISSRGVEPRERFQAEELAFQERLFLARRSRAGATAGRE